MKISKIDYRATGAFSSLLTDYIAQDPKLTPFYNRYPALENFKSQMQEKQFSGEQRTNLINSLQRQYASVLNIQAEVQQNLELLKKPTTYTVTTGHQLNIFTGPLYFVYKIISTINLAKQLKSAYPECDFVPVYWMATEDHDFAEVNHFTLFGKPYSWETDQKGAVGRFSTESMSELLASLPEHYPLFEEAYTQSATLADATRVITHALFGQYGLVAIDGDDKELKQAFKPVIRKELQEQSSQKLVNEVSDKLAEHYKPQVMSREINLFYLDENLRERLVLEDGQYKVLNTTLTFSPAEIEKLIEETPEKFSPNVILRPLYQEMVLPNLAYIGGGAEVTYWCQLKGVFDANGVTYPMVMLRNSALYISKPNANRRQKLNLSIEDLFKDTAALKKQIMAQFEQEELTLEAERKQIESVFEQITQLANKVDPTLAKTVAAEAQKTQNSLMMLEKKLVKANETKYETYFSQLTGLKEKLFPNGTLQERVDNLLTYQTNNPEFIQNLIEAFNPLENKFTVLEEE
ncbi:bacillithiol biosynthesis cysteine-adding enzyme BshC [Adhaeribacter aquaticus]|uniref:bacillithiol biosynthesis cysteine-adding enzyme BshC n=1 Tax=Adhaeribacter aquaticus TaxID=299567 RepID=UPI0004243043|nr:bacillithiol biosynthesis cysteine-adding enzyme BshC [Adhaeribacter aquaticus]